VQLEKIPPYAKYLSSIGVDAVLGELLYIICSHLSQSQVNVQKVIFVQNSKRTVQSGAMNLPSS
jgi:hypothetical protein